MIESAPCSAAAFCGGFRHGRGILSRYDNRFPATLLWLALLLPALSLSSCASAGAPVAGQGASPGGTGTGIVLDHSSHILTSHHLVLGCDSLVLRHENLVLRARPGPVDEKLDLAILVPEARFPAEPAIFRNARPVPGEPVVIAGFPREVVGQGLLKAVSAGIATVRDPSLQQGMMRLTQGLSQGASGGPVLDRSGRVIGILSGLLINSRSGKPVDAPGVAVRGEAVQAFLQRSGIRFRLGDGKPATLSDIARRVSRQTVMIECSGR